jgi:tetratricopeptide (TPR) repeat protein
MRDLNWGKRLVAIVGVAAGIAAIFAYVGFNPFALTPPKPANVLEQALNATSTLPTISQLQPLETKTQAACVQADEGDTPVSASKCWLGLSSLYVGTNQYRLALGAIERALDEDVRVADPYYALGNLYYELLLFDAVRARRFQIVKPQQLLVNIEPNDDSVALAHLASAEFQQAQGLPFIGTNVFPRQVQVTSQQQIAQTQSALNAITNGASELPLVPTDVLALDVFVKEVYPQDQALQYESSLMSHPLEQYFGSHPDMFPGFPSASQAEASGG